MNVEKSMYQMPVGSDPMDDDIELEIPEDEFDPNAEFEIMEDGSAELIGEMDDVLPPLDQLPPDANLVEYFDDHELDEIASLIIEAYEADDEARSDWKQAYADGLDLLGMKIEEREEPFPGASGVHHPLLAEAVVQFQAQAYKELLPAGGPVEVKVVGDKTPERLLQAARVKDYMNYIITEEMVEYDPDMDQLLFYLPLSGSAFKKTYFDPAKQRTVSKFVTADRITVPYSATSLEDAPRIIHDFPLTGNDILKYQATGFYAESHLSAPQRADKDEIREKVDELQHTSPSYFEHDEEYTILEAHINLDDEMLADPETVVALPYIVTLDKDSETILAIRKNYDPEDPLKRRLDHFTHYKFLPGLGFYGFGLIHLIGGLSKSATSILRQLIDAGTFANMQGGFKAKGMRVAGEDEPIAPGEWRDVDTPGGNLRESLMPLPYKEPSQVLAALLGNLVETGQRFASIADMQVGDTSGQQQPVGTTVAMLERGTKVMSSIHKRLHRAQKQEFRILARLISQALPVEMYPYEVKGAPQGILKQDFDARVDIIPVSDPNIFSMAQRIMLASQQLQMAMAAPEQHNLHEAYRRMYAAMGVTDIESLLKPEQKPQPLTPLEEHRQVLMNQKLEAVPEMDHQAHIQMHLQFLTNPYMQQNIEFASNVVQDIFNHVTFLSKAQAQQTGQKPEYIQMQMMQQIMPQLTPPPQRNPMEELQSRQLDIEEAYNKGKLQNEQIKIQTQAKLDAEELASEERREAAKIQKSIDDLILRRDELMLRDSQHKLSLQQQDRQHARTTASKEAFTGSNRQS